MKISFLHWAPASLGFPHWELRPSIPWMVIKWNSSSQAHTKAEHGTKWKQACVRAKAPVQHMTEMTSRINPTPAATSPQLGVRTRSNGHRLKYLKLGKNQTIKTPTFYTVSMIQNWHSCLERLCSPILRGQTGHSPEQPALCQAGTVSAHHWLKWTSRENSQDLLATGQSAPISQQSTLSLTDKSKGSFVLWITNSLYP